MIETRPGIAYAIGKLSQHAENPSKLHWIAVKRVFRYINNIENLVYCTMDVKRLMHKDFLMQTGVTVRIAANLLAVLHF